MEDYEKTPYLFPGLSPNFEFELQFRPLAKRSIAHPLHKTESQRVGHPRVKARPPACHAPKNRKDVFRAQKMWSSTIDRAAPSDDDHKM
jgi:hypothetical protein